MSAKISSGTQRQHSDSLFQFIKSLSKAEKRYFKLSASIEIGEKSYMLLFDSMERQPIYNNEKLCKALNKSNKQLANEKNYLYNLLLKTLANNHKSIDTLILNSLARIELLHSKNLPAECFKVLQKAKQIAIKYELYRYLFQLLQWELRLPFSGQYNEKEIQKTIDEQQKTLKIIFNINSLDAVSRKVTAIYYDIGHIHTVQEKKQLHKIMSHPLL